MNKQAYERIVGMVMGTKQVLSKRAADMRTVSVDRRNNKSKHNKPDTRDEAYGVNSVLALSGMAGLGILNAEDKSGNNKLIGSALSVAPLTAGAAYHTVRGLKGNAASRITALLAGYIAGGAGGFALGKTFAI